MAQFQKLEVWSKAHEFVLDIYTLTKSFPQEEKYRLVDQICRSASSIPTNIAEGSGRNTDKDFVYFLCIARGSLYEVKYQLILSRDLGYISIDIYDELFKKSDLIGKMLNALISKLKSGV